VYAGTHEKAWQRRRICKVSTRVGMFVDRIVGPDLSRVLLGLPRPTVVEQQRRAERARDDILRELGYEMVK
jgi:hypothetical protein